MSVQEKNLSPKPDRGVEFRAVMSMSVPMVISTCSPLVMRVADFAFVSTLGTAAQAAILPAQMALWCYMAMSIGLVTSVNTLAAQSLGRERPRDCGAYAWQSLYLSAGLGIAGLGMWFIFPPLFAAAGHDPEVQSLEVLYTRISVWSILPTVAAQALGAFFTGIHRPRVTMMAAIESNVLNIVLNYGLIFGAFGLPRLGFGGAAVGTVIAASYQAVRLLLVLSGGRTQRAFATRETWRIDWPKLRGLFRVGFPQGLQWLSEVTVWSAFNLILIGRFGTIELAATNLAWQYIRIGFMPMIGVGQAITALVGKAIGQADPAQAMRFAHLGAKVTFAYVAVLSLFYILWREWLVELFSSNPAVIAIGTKIMCCVALFQLFDVLGQVYYHALRGAGDTKWPMVMMVVSHWLVIIGGGFLVTWLKPEWGSLGPWVVATVLISLTGVLLWRRWQSRAWIKIDLFADQAHPPETSESSQEPASPDALEQVERTGV